MASVQDYVNSLSGSGLLQHSLHILLWQLYNVDQTPNISVKRRAMIGKDELLHGFALGPWTVIPVRGLLRKGG